MASQKNRHMAIIVDLGDKGKSTGSGADDVLLLRGLSGSDGISDSFSYDLELLSNKNDLGTSPLHKNATIVFRDPNGNPKRYINGEIFEFAVCGMVYVPRENVDERLFLYKARLAPALEMLKHSCRTKIHTGESVKDIVDGVFSQAATSNFGYSNPLPANYCDSSKLSASYKKLACCVQYQESDFDFVSRLMQSEGISYYFTHKQGSHTMVLAEKNSDFSTHSGDIDYDYSNAYAGIYSFTQNERLIPYSTDDYPKSRDFSYQLMDNSHEGGLGDVSGDPNSIYNVYADSARFLDKKEEMGARLTSFKQFLRERSVVEKYDWSGKTHWMDVDAGTKFVMNKFPVGSTPGVNILVSHTSTTSTCRYDLDGQGTQPIEDYENIFDTRFQALDSNKTFRPAMNTPKPKVYGLQTGIIITNTGYAKHVTESDEYARVKVKPHWGDSTTEHGDEFCWARVAQDRANNGHGLFSLPRVGEEVVVSFVNGDLEEPLVVGSVYNSHCKPPMSISSTSNNQPDMLLRSRQVSKANTWNEFDAIVEQSAPVDEMDMSDLKKDDKRKGFHELSLNDTRDEERVGLYSNGKILAQAPEDIVVKGGKKITIEAGEELELIVGHSKISLTEDVINAAILKKTDIQLVPYLWDAEIPGTGTFMKLQPDELKISSIDIKLLGWLSASMSSLFAGTEAGLMDHSTHGIAIGNASGIQPTTAIDAFTYFSAMSKGKDVDPSQFSHLIALLTAGGCIISLLTEGYGFGSGFVNLEGSEHAHLPGFMNVPLIGPVPLSFVLGKHEIKSTGSMHSETLENVETLGKKTTRALEKAKEIVEDTTDSVKHTISSIVKSKQTVSEEDEGIEMQEMGVSKTTTEVEAEETVGEKTKTGLMDEDVGVMKSGTRVMHEDTNALENDDNAIEMHEM